MLCAVLSLVLTATSYGQSQTFTDSSVEYTFDLPNTTWKMTVKPSEISPNVEYVFGDRMNGHLEVRKLTVKQNDLMGEVVAGEEEKLKFLQGYVAGKEENFAGNLRGNIFNYEYVRSGRNMSGRFYFLRANPTTVYILRFTGLRDKLLAVRNQIDLIARTFEIRKAS